MATGLLALAPAAGFTDARNVPAWRKYKLPRIPADSLRPAVTATERPASKCGS